MLSHTPMESLAAATIGSTTSGRLSLNRSMAMGLLLAIMGLVTSDFEPSSDDSIQTVDFESVISILL